jgi:YebC/PmpR family DNA-binding regulatory protein
MSGHSKWATIRRKKGAVDAKRGKIFTKLIREIATAARMGGGDPAGNPRLRLAIDKGRAANMPKDNIERAILKGTGGGDSESWEEAVYEGYGPGGAAVYVEALTDNRNRTAGEVRHVFTKFGGNLGGSGCVAHLFERKGSLVFERAALDPDALLEAALDAGADDVVESDDQLEVVTSGAEFGAVKRKLEDVGFRPAQAALQMRPSLTVRLAGQEAEQMLRLSDALEDLDDVQAVSANFDISDEEMQRLAG